MLADWSTARRRAEISVFNDHVADTAAVVERRHPMTRRSGRRGANLSRALA